jgi:hypothetical protein
VCSYLQHTCMDIYHAITSTACLQDLPLSTENMCALLLSLFPIIFLPCWRRFVAMIR